MRVYRSLEQIETASPNGRVVGIGVFDGVHRGHQCILAGVVEEARHSGRSAVAVTFDPHPETVLRPGSAPRLLTTLERKAALIAELGIDELVVVPFDHEFSRLSPQAFCERVLSARLDARVVYVGENFRFGHKGQGTAALLAEYGAAHGFVVEAVALAEEAGQPISSTRVRKLLDQGRVQEAARLLGRPHRVEGTVVPGVGRGRTLGAPTANVEVDREVALPKAGVYVTATLVDGGRSVDSVTSVGTNPTFGDGKEVRVETLLLDFSGDLYGRRLAVDFLERIRGQRAFPDAESLVEAIRKDVESARAVHARIRGMR